MLLFKKDGNKDFDRKVNIGIFIKAGIVLWLFFFSLMYMFWYAKNDMNEFHFFNDLHGWRRMDKIGHFYFSFQSAYLFGFWMILLGFEKIKAAQYAFVLGFMVLFPIEILDGFSEAWGFSISDLCANTLGCLFASFLLSRKKLPSIFPKFTFHLTAFASLRPNLLGDNFLFQCIKDYNGQTYWLSLRLSDVFKTKIFPPWLLLSIGYGAEGMIGSDDNKFTSNGKYFDMTSIVRYSQWYISFDIDWTYILPQNRYILHGFYFLNFFKIPAPTLEFNNQNGLRFHWIYW